MDNLTHTAIGLFLSRAGLNRWTPGATAVLLLAANAPDIDVLSAAGGPAAYLHYHRHLTHSLAAMPAMAAAAVAAARWIARQPVRWVGAFAAALIGVASHLLLDWTNVYGIRLLLPFSSAWLRLDTVSVVDLWIWAALLMGLAAPFLGRLVGSEISSGHQRPRAYGRAAALTALALVLLYEASRGLLHARATAILESRVYDGAAPLRVAALPDPVNPLRWRGVIETTDFFVLPEVDLAGPFDPTRAPTFQKPDPNPALDAVRANDTIRQFLAFSQIPLWRVLPAPEPENAHEVDIFDLRFGTPAAPGFMATAIVDAGMRVVRADVRFGAPRLR